LIEAGKAAIQKRATWASLHWPNLDAIAHEDVARALSEAALAVFEQAHTPTDDEREARARITAKLDRIPDSDAVTLDKADVRTALRRTVQGEPTATVATKPAIDEVRKVLDYYADEIDVSIWQEIASAVDDIPDCETWTAAPHAEHVQGEPTDAQVLAALEAYWGPQSTGFWFADQIKSMRAALRAAAATTTNREDGGK